MSIQSSNFLCGQTRLVSNFLVWYLNENTAYTSTRQRGNKKANELPIVSGTGESQIRIPAKDIERRSTKISKEDFQMWHHKVGQVRGQQYFMMFLDNGPNPWFAKCRLNRRTVTSICGLRNGHTPLTCFNILPNGICACETSEETPDHVVWKC
jgi:hypothetical protein